MLLEDFNKWVVDQHSKVTDVYDNEDLFGIFYQERSFGKSFAEMMNDLAWQIYNLQVCVEGLIEDNS